MFFVFLFIWHECSAYVNMRNNFTVCFILFHTKCFTITSKILLFFSPWFLTRTALILFLWIETARKEIFLSSSLNYFGIYLQYNDWSALDKIIFVSTRFQHWRMSPEEKVSFENVAVSSFLRNQKECVTVEFCNLHKMLIIFAKLKLTK